MPAISQAAPTNPAPRTPPRMLYVKRSTALTPHLRRITLSGPQIQGFPIDSAGAHIKLFLARDGQHVPVLPTLGPEGPIYPPPEIRAISRTYTVARFDAQAGELDVDFVIHGEHGPASSWASRAQVGDAIGIAGPGGPALIKQTADAYLLAGDPSAFAAIRAALASLPANAQGLCLLEVANRDEVLPMLHPPGIDLQWLIRGAQASAALSNLLLDAARAWQWPQGEVSVTLAGESSQLVRLRKFVLQERNVAKDALYAVPYWKEELSEEAYHAERHRIMDEITL